MQQSNRLQPSAQHEFRASHDAVNLLFLAFFSDSGYQCGWPRFLSSARHRYSCKTLGDFFTTGCLEHTVLPRDMARAFKAFQFGCLTETRPDGEACSRVAQMLLTGEGCDQNQARQSPSTCSVSILPSPRMPLWFQRS